MTLRATPKRSARENGDPAAGPSSEWRAEIELRARQLEAALAGAEARRADDERPSRDGFFDTYANIVRERIDDARAATAQDRGWQRFRQWLSGSSLEIAWRSLHAADAALTMILPARSLEALVPEVQASLTTVLGEKDARTKAYLDALATFVQDKSLDEHRDDLSEMRESIDASSDVAHANIRSYRNWLFGISTVVIIVLAAVAIAHAFDSSFLGIGVPDSPDADLLQVEMAGAVGGLLMALFALIRLNVYSGPFNLPFWQALVRIPAGAAAALVGVALLQGQVLTVFKPAGDETTLLAYAVLFGAAPEIVLRFLDKQVNDASNAARTKNDPLKDVPPPSTA